MLAVPIGHALAVSPRSERIEPPVILGTRLTADRSQWELVVARHGEEALAASNRSLFARLGTEGTALTFLREYRTPQWPETLHHALTGDAPPPEDVQLYPVRRPSAPSVPDAVSAVDGDVVDDLAGTYPALWKGADIWRIDDLHPHYRVTALAVARAGLVVSPVVSAVQDATPRRTLNDPAIPPADILGEPELVIARAGDASLLKLVALRLVAHHDLSIVRDPPSAPNDIDWWPDPAVTYALFRQRALPDGATLEDEEATVSLLATGITPFVIRCRGPRLIPVGDATNPGLSAVTTTVTGNARTFHLEFTLTPNPKPGVGSQTGGSTVNLDTLSRLRRQFNVAAQGFATASGTDLVVSGFADPPVDLDKAKIWLIARAADVTAEADKLAATSPATIVAAVRGIADDLTLEATELIDVIPLMLTRDRRRPIDLDPDQPPPAGLPTAPLKIEVQHTVERLTVTRLPTLDEARRTQATDHPFARSHDPNLPKPGEALLWRLCKRMLLGDAAGFRVRAVDTRNAIEIQTIPGAQPKATAPGEIVVAVKLPEWVTWAPKENQ